MTKPAKIGSWGGDGGTGQDVRKRPSKLVSVNIRSGDTIDAISFTYVASDGTLMTEGPWGGKGGIEHQIDLCHGNYVTEISGTTGAYSAVGNVVTSLEIVTYNSGTAYTYGKAAGDPFRIRVLDGGRIVGFFGRSGIVLDAIGTYVLP